MIDLRELFIRPGVGTMSLMDRIKKNFHLQSQQESQNALFPYFMRLEGEGQFPFLLALGALEELEKSASTDKELLDYLLEDIIFTSIYATFYEQLMVTVHENAEHCIPLIDKFSEGGHQREQIIATQTQKHYDYILNEAYCEGCECCENHGDVDELIPKWKNGELDFFLSLYIGMQTIQYSMEHILYDVIPHGLIHT